MIKVVIVDAVRERERELLSKPPKFKLKIGLINLKTIFCGIVYRIKNKGHPLII